MFTFTSEERMKALIAKANKIIAKLNLAPISIISTELVKVKDPESDLPMVVVEAELSIPTELVRVGGQEIVARIESLDGVNMITRISNDGVDLKAYRDAEITCDHCGLKRNRKASWVVKSEERGVIQVGDSCADLYFGVDVLRLLRASAQIAQILDDEDWEGGSRRQNRFNFEVFTSVVVWHSMTKGFVTKKQAGDYGVSTSEEAEFLAMLPTNLNDQRQREYEKHHAAHEAWRADHFKGENLYDMALDWWLAREDDSLSEFEHNCKVAILSQDVRFLGLSAYGLKLWADAQFGLNQPNKTSAYVGEKGVRSVFNQLKVTHIGSSDNAFGTTTIVTFEDPSRNELVWFATTDPNVTLGETYKVKATVKDHKERKGIKQTIITRAAIMVA